MRVADLILAIALCAVAGWMMSCMNDRATARPSAVEVVGTPSSIQRLVTGITARLSLRRASVAEIPADPGVVPVVHPFHPALHPSTAATRRSGDYQC